MKKRTKLKLILCISAAMIAGCTDLTNSSDLTGLTLECDEFVGEPVKYASKLFYDINHSGQEYSYNSASSIHGARKLEKVWENDRYLILSDREINYEHRLDKKYLIITIFDHKNSPHDVFSKALCRKKLNSLKLSPLVKLTKIYQRLFQ